MAQRINKNLMIRKSDIKEIEPVFLIMTLWAGFFFTGCWLHNNVPLFSFSELQRTIELLQLDNWRMAILGGAGISLGLFGWCVYKKQNLYLIHQWLFCISLYWIGVSLLYLTHMPLTLSGGLSTILVSSCINVYRNHKDRLLSQLFERKQLEILKTLRGD